MNATILKLAELLYACNSVHITINQHKAYYQDVLYYLEENISEIDPAVLQKMVELDRIVEIQWYPVTPVGFYMIYHHDFDAAVAEFMELRQAQAIRALKSGGGE